jgi:hypothetical protein
MAVVASNGITHYTPFGSILRPHRDLEIDSITWCRSQGLPGLGVGRSMDHGIGHEFLAIEFRRQATFTLEDGHIIRRSYAMASQANENSMC